MTTAATGDARASGYVPARLIWTHGSGAAAADLLAGLVVSLLLDQERMVYWVTPTLEDFILFDNSTRQMAAPLPAFADQREVRFSDVISVLAKKHRLRLICADDVRAKSAAADFERTPVLSAAEVQQQFTVRFGKLDRLPHGLLVENAFFVDGVFRTAHERLLPDSEVVRVHLNETAGAKQAIAGAVAAIAAAWDRFGPVETSR